MSRKVRERAKKLPHHIMSQCIPELMLFNTEEDKDYYLNLIKVSSVIYRIQIIAYCLMDNHIHLLVHPRGGDISKFMRAINNPYAKYYNKTYGRRGHLFSERFVNIVIKSEAQLLRTSTYIHNNPKDLLWKGYMSIEDYPYSSIKDYVKPKQGRGIANAGYIFSIMGGGWTVAQNHYLSLLEIQSQGDETFEREMEEAFKKGSYESDKMTIIREEESIKVINTIAKRLNVSNTAVRHIKYRKKYRMYKSLLAVSLRIFCDMSLSDMTKEFKGHTSATIGNLAREGYELLEEDQSLFDDITQSLMT